MLETKYVDDFQEFYDKVSEHFVDHFSSCEEARQGKQELNIDIGMFQHLIDSGNVNFFTLHIDEDVLVGYLNVSITQSPLFKKPQAVIDFLYILPEHRRSNYATEAITEVEKELKAQGLQDCNICLPNKDYSQQVAESLGYVPTTTTHTKFLGE